MVLTITFQNNFNMKHFISILLLFFSIALSAQGIDATVTKAYRVDSITGGAGARYFVTKLTVEMPDGQVRITEEKLRFVNIDSVDAYVTRYRAQLVAMKTKAEDFVDEKTAEISALDGMPQQRGGILIISPPPIPGLNDPAPATVPAKNKKKKKG